jgi:hypothetical protein
MIAIDVQVAGNDGIQGQVSECRLRAAYERVRMKSEKHNKRIAFSYNHFR